MNNAQKLYESFTKSTDPKIIIKTAYEIQTHFESIENQKPKDFLGSNFSGIIRNEKPNSIVWLLLSIIIGLNKSPFDRYYYLLLSRINTSFETYALNMLQCKWANLILKEIQPMMNNHDAKKCEDLIAALDRKINELKINVKPQELIDTTPNQELNMKTDDIPVNTALDYKQIGKLYCYQCGEEFKLSTSEEDPGLCLQCKNKLSQENQTGKYFCYKCGVAITSTTIQKNHGLCMPCKRKLEQYIKEQHVKPKQSYCFRCGVETSFSTHSMNKGYCTSCEEDLNQYSQSILIASATTKNSTIPRFVLETDKITKELKIIIVSKKEIMKCNIKSVFKILNELKYSPEVALSHQNGVSITISGYDNDHREIWQIPEVRQYIAALNTKFPYWVFFLQNTIDNVAIIRCLLPTINQGVEVTAQYLMKHLLPNWIEGMHEIAKLVGLNKKDGEKILFHSVYEGNLLHTAIRIK